MMGASIPGRSAPGAPSPGGGALPDQGQELLGVELPGQRPEPGARASRQDHGDEHETFTSVSILMPVSPDGATCQVPVHWSRMDPLGFLHPLVRAWFERRFPAADRAAGRGWPAIAAGADTLIAAPTGSGKTLAAFLVCIDRLFGAGHGAAESTTTQVVYVSPLKALATTSSRTCEVPLAEIARSAPQPAPGRPRSGSSVRTGDTPARGRADAPAARRTSWSPRPSRSTCCYGPRAASCCGTVDDVIVDEIHALARDKRGSHLALSLERLEALCAGGRRARIGLSATQRPIERSPASWSATGRRVAGTADRRLRPPRGTRPGARSARQRAVGRLLARAVGRSLRPARRADRARIAARWSSSTRGGWPSGWPTTWRAAGRETPSPAITAACRKDRRSGRAAAQGGRAARRSWPRPRWSWASTSAPSTWSARSARRARSPRSCSGSAAPALAGRRCPRAPVPADPRRAAGMPGPARARAARAGSTRSRSPRRRSTSWPSRSWPPCACRRVAEGTISSSCVRRPGRIAT